MNSADYTGPERTGLAMDLKETVKSSSAGFLQDVRVLSSRTLPTSYTEHEQKYRWDGD